MPIDLRSDTVTRPTPAMREAIARAVVGDDALRDDPTVAALEERVAALLGKEAALFFPTGTMANQTALHLLGRPGTEAIVEAHCHILDWEMGAPAVFSGLQLRPVSAPDGRLTAAAVAGALREPAGLRIRTSVVCIENTHNAAGGRILPLQDCRAIADLARAHDLPVHLDGARLWNAAIASGIDEAEYAACADTVMVTLSKGLGCPAGSLLAANAARIEEGRIVRRRLGGAMRQAGILAAAGIHALEHHRERLSEDHRRARDLAAAIAGLPAIDVIPPDTNIVMFDIRRADLDTATLLERLEQHDVLFSDFGPRRVRAVTHLDIGDDDIAAAAAALRIALAA